MRKIIAVNRKASHEYFLTDRYEAGLVLQGTEIKSIRKGSVQLKDAYISFINQEAFIKEMHIPPYDFGNRFNHDETRIQEKVQIKGFTIVPVSLYLEKGKAKLEIALAKGKNLHDKRESEKARDANREIQKALKNQFY